MAQTIRDFIIECELYPYSRDNFEFMKENSELELTEKYIADQIYLSEARASLADYSIEENYLHEAVDSVTIEVLMEKYIPKAGSLMAKIITKLMKLLRTFSRFFGKIATKFDTVTNQGQEVLSKLNSLTMDEEKLAKLQEIIATVKSNESSNFPVRSNQPFKSNIKLKYTGGTDTNKLRDDLAAALSNTVVVANVFLNEDETDIDIDKITIVDPDVLMDSVMQIYSGGEAEIKNSLQKLLTHFMVVKTRGLEIKVNTKAISQVADDLTKVSDKLNAVVSELGQSAYALRSMAAMGVSTVKMFNDAKAAADAKKQADGSKPAGLPAPDPSSTPGDTGGADSGSGGNSAIDKTKGILKLVGDMASGKTELPDASAITNLLTKLTAVCNKVTSNTSKVYVSLNGYRQGVIKALHEYLKNIK